MGSVCSASVLSTTCRHLIEKRGESGKGKRGKGKERRVDVDHLVENGNYLLESCILQTSITLHVVLSCIPCRPVDMSEMHAAVALVVPCPMAVSAAHGLVSVFKSQTV